MAKDASSANPENGGGSKPTDERFLAPKGPAAAAVKPAAAKPTAAPTNASQPAAGDPKTPSPTTVTPTASAQTTATQTTAPQTTATQTASGGQPTVSINTSSAKAVPAAAKAAPATARPVASTAKTAAPAKVANETSNASTESAKATAAKAASAEASEGDDEDEEDSEPGRYKFLLFNAVPSWAVSGLVHAVALMVLALSTFEKVSATKSEIVAKAYDEAGEIETFSEDTLKPIDVAEVAPTEMTNAISSDVPMDAPDVSAASDLDAAPAAVEFSDFGEQLAPRNELVKQIGVTSGTGISGRGSAKSRAALVASAGGTPQSEAAVGLALRWLARHQLPDGGWNFDHRIGQCQGQCDHQGSLENARNGATGLALLPFLGAGQTHREGEYKDVVKRGLYFLVQNMKNNKQGGGDLADGGSMYSHGICAIVLSEAYAMTHDKELMLPAQMALNHIIYAQDPVGGGWRYSPRTPGDTSAVGWQLMALKSGHMAYLKVPQGTVIGASKFLDSVQMESGAKYGYTGPGPAPGTTAVGLLCRMYLGWKKDNAALQRGVEYLSTTGPSKGNMYYNYYATQIMRHWGGDEWDKWNKGMRDFLISEQSKQGHKEGSWFMDGGDHGAGVGGRIYCTAMATMILEVYYRHMPIYGESAAEEDFPL